MSTVNTSPNSKQCDGCNANMPKVEGLHRHMGNIHMACTNTDAPDLPSFDPSDKDHILALSSFWETGVWPVETDIADRYNDPLWVSTIAFKVAEVHIKHVKGN